MTVRRDHGQSAILELSTRIRVWRNQTNKRRYNFTSDGDGDGDVQGLNTIDIHTDTHTYTQSGPLLFLDGRRRRPSSMPTDRVWRHLYACQQPRQCVHLSLRGKQSTTPSSRFRWWKPVDFLLVVVLIWLWIDVFGAFVLAYRLVVFSLAMDFFLVVDSIGQTLFFDEVCI